MQNGCLRSPYKELSKEEKWKAKEKRKDIPIWMQFQRTASRNKNAFLSDQCKEIEEKHSMEKIEISSRKLEIPREHFMQNGHNKGQKWYGPDRSRRY